MKVPRIITALEHPPIKEAPQEVRRYEGRFYAPGQEIPF